MQHKLIISSKLKLSLQNSFFPENRQTDSQITNNCSGFNLQNIIFEAGDTATEILIYTILFCSNYVRKFIIFLSNHTAFAVIIKVLK